MPKGKTIKIIISIVAALLCIYLAIGFIFYHFALNANSNQSRNIGEKVYVPSEAIDSEREQIEREKDRAFLNNMTPKTYTISSHDGLTLKSYTYEQSDNTNKWVFAVHGYTGSSRQMVRWNRYMYELGYNVFSMDLRGHGQSEGDYYGMGWLDQPDLQSWLSYIIQLHPEANITLFGVSMGASSVLNLAANDLPSQVTSVIADSGFTSVASIFETQLHNTLHLPSFPIMNAANTIAKWRIDLDFYKASTVELVPNIDLPILFIHGDDDTFVPVENVYELEKATTAVHDLWVVKKANHGEAIKVEPDEYKQKVSSFIEQHN